MLGSQTVYSNEVTIYFIDPCGTTSLQTQSISNMTFQLGQDSPTTQTFNFFMDQVSL
jgi:hypothetical protein